MKPNVKQLKQLVGNPDAYALQRKQGGWEPVREPLEPQVLRKHLAGELTVGTYIVKGDQARTLVFDVDAEDEAAARPDLQKLVAVLIDINRKGDAPVLSWGVEFSGKKGYHVWVLAADFMPATVLYQLGRGIREEAGLPKLEVFPKQTVARDLGNLVKLPGGVHRVTGKANDFIGLEFPEPNSVEQLTALAAKYPETTAGRVGPQTVEFPCIDAIQAGIQEGGRNTALFHLATFLRKNSLTDENVESVVSAANKEFDPPLPPEEVANIIAGSVHSGMLCDQLDAELHCGAQCIKARHPGLYMRNGAVRHAPDGDLVVVTLTGRGTEGVVEISHPDIVQARAVLADPPKRRKK